MKFHVLLVSFFTFSITISAQFTDSLIIGKWNLFKIMNNLNGEEIIPPKPNETFQFYLIFSEDSTVRFNLEINKCNTSFVTPVKNEIEFLYFSSCTEMCCDREFSELLSYDECTSYYLKNENILVLISEDRIYYFNRSSE